MKRSGSAILCLSFSLLSACGPEGAEPHEDRDEPDQYATATCEAADRCGCYNPFPSRETCEDVYSGRLAALLDSGLDFDDDCFNDGIESAAVETCATTAQTPPMECTVLQGHKSKGAACTEWHRHVPPFIVDECEGDLVCQYGTCLLPEESPPTVAEGASCSLHDGSVCPSHPYGSLFCGGDGICHATSPLGAACTSPDGCVQDDLLRIPDERERQDRSIVNTRIGAS
jgi:hypothetical protein